MTTADSQILPAIRALAETVNPQEWSEAGVLRGRDQVLADLNVRSRRLNYLEQDGLRRLAFLRHPARLPSAGRAEQVAGIDPGRLAHLHRVELSRPRHDDHCCW